MDKQLKAFLLLAILVSLPIFSYCETIKLRTGKTVEGKIIDKTDEYVKVNVAGVDVKYYSDEVDTITGSPTAQPKKITSGEWRAYQDKENNFSISVPSSWVMVTGKECRKIANEKLDEEFANDPKWKGKTFENTEFEKQLKEGLMMTLVPVMAFYEKNAPDLLESDIPNISITMNNNSQDTIESIEEMNAITSKCRPDIRFIEKSHRVNINGANGVKRIMFDPKGFLISECSVLLGTRSVRIRCVAKNDAVDKYKAIFDKAINSFNIKEK
jgi:hypothetical protein